MAETIEINAGGDTTTGEAPVQGDVRQEGELEDDIGKFNPNFSLHKLISAVM